MHSHSCSQESVVQRMTLEGPSMDGAGNFGPMGHGMPWRMSKTVCWRPAKKRSVSERKLGYGCKVFSSCGVHTLWVKSSSVFANMYLGSYTGALAGLQDNIARPHSSSCSGERRDRIITGSRGALINAHWGQVFAPKEFFSGILWSDFGRPLRFWIQRPLGHLQKLLRQYHQKSQRIFPQARWNSISCIFSSLAKEVHFIHFLSKAQH